MKKTTLVSSETYLHPLRRSARRFRSRFAVSTLLLATAALLGAGAVFRAAALDHFPILGDPLPDSLNESTPSLGILQVTVTDLTMQGLLNPDSTHIYPYYGWLLSSSTLASPLLSDRDTRIAASYAHQRKTLTVNQTYFPVTVGMAGVDLSGNPLTANTILSYLNPLYYWPDPFACLLFPGPVPLFDFNYSWVDGPIPPAQNPDEMLTEIQRLNLATIAFCNTNDNPALPPAGSVPGNTIMVRAGYNNGYIHTGPSGRSIGMAQSQQHPAVPWDGNPFTPKKDFPANSFFNIYVEVTLPPVANTISADAFKHEVMPGVWADGAVLYNSDPMLLVSKDLDTIPPSVAYVHETSAATPWPVDLIFAHDGPFITGSTTTRYYHAGDVLGQIILAGHGTDIGPCSKSLTKQAFYNAVVGPAGQSAPRPPAGRLLGTTAFPSPATVYKSIPGTNFAGTSWDEVMFTNVTALHARDFVIGSLVSPIALPTFGNSVTYTSPTVVTLDVSSDGTFFIPAQATGTVQVLIVNTNPVVGDTTTYYTELLSLTAAGTTGSGSSFKLRESATNNSAGVRIVEDKGGGVYKIGGYVDAFIQYGFNNGLVWKAGNRAIRLEEKEMANCGVATNRLSASMVGASTVKVQWANGNYRLQGRVSLSSTYSWEDLPYTSPYIFNIPGTYQYFRLVCP